MFHTWSVEAVALLARLLHVHVGGQRRHLLDWLPARRMLAAMLALIHSLALMHVITGGKFFLVLPVPMINVWAQPKIVIYVDMNCFISIHPVDICTLQKHPRAYLLFKINGKTCSKTFVLRQ